MAAKKKNEGTAMKLLDILTSPWLIIPEKLLEIQEIYRTHLRGEKIDIKEVEAKTGQSLENEREAYEVINDIAVVPVHGIIAKRMNLFMKISGGVSTQLLANDLHDVLMDDAIKGVILDIDSPGGTVDGTQELASMIHAARGKKPIAVHTDGYLASAAYWIGSAAHEVWISGDTVSVGSIGVVLAHTDYSEREKQEGIKTTEIYAGKYKRIASEYKPLSKEGKKYLQDQVDYIYSVFVDDVARNRGKGVDYVLREMADGKIFIGRQALSNGLVDGVSTLPDLIDRMTTGDVVMVPPNARPSAHDKEETMDLTTLKEEFPELYEAIRKEGFDAGVEEGLEKGKAAELDRIKSVQDQLIPGHEALIEELKFDGATTGPEAAVKILAAEKVLHEKKMEELEKDSIDPVQHANAPEADKAQEMPRAEFNKKSPEQQREFVSSGGKVVD